MPSAAVRGLLAAFLMAMLPAAAAHAAGQATVRGAEVVNVREGPSLNSPVFLSLQRGRVVTVEKLVGDWAQVVLESGRKGYVRSLYLALPAEIESMAGQTGTLTRAAAGRSTPTLRSDATSAAPTVTPAALLSGTPAAAETQSPDPSAGVTPDGLHSEVAELRKRLAALESAVVATPGTGESAERHDSPRPTAAVAAAGEREPTRVPILVPTAVQLPDPQELGPSLALAGVGLVIGFLLGAAYGQRQERKRRNRVRF
jgi:hypothetical protein